MLFFTLHRSDESPIFGQFMVTQKIGMFYTLRKSKKVLWQLHRRYQRKMKTLDPHAREKIQNHLVTLQTAILQKDAQIADRLARQLQEIAEKWMPKSPWDKVRDAT